jgi:septal ring factor EnvC (AmiA/AmiB activator)
MDDDAMPTQTSDQIKRLEEEIDRTTWAIDRQYRDIQRSERNIKFLEDRKEKYLRDISDLKRGVNGTTGS